MPAESVCYCGESSEFLLFVAAAVDLIKLLEFMDEDDEEIVWPRVYLADVSNPLKLLKLLIVSSRRDIDFLKTLRVRALFSFIGLS